MGRFARYPQRDGVDPSVKLLPELLRALKREANDIEDTEETRVEKPKRGRLMPSVIDLVNWILTGYLTMGEADRRAAMERGRADFEKIQASPKQLKIAADGSIVGPAGSVPEVVKTPGKLEHGRPIGGDPGPPGRIGRKGRGGKGLGRNQEASRDHD